jgi:integrative and conjugative element protein (TIGR02256 family)
VTVPSVVLAADALVAMQRAGEAALPRETGGILAGFRSGESIVVTRALLVADPASTRVTYQLDRASAEAMLDDLRADAPPVVGFVGDWHTHPRDVPPSALDLESLAQSAVDSTDLVALLVLPYTGARPGFGYARVAAAGPARRARRRRSPVRVQPANLLLTDITAEALELEAQDTQDRASTLAEPS